MSDRIKLTKASLLNDLDDRELFEGYCDGRDGFPEPGNNRSYSYWHGWRNGAMDGGHIPHDNEARALAHDVIKTGYLKRGSQ